MLPRSQGIWNSLDDLKERMNDDQKRANEIAQMRGASNWLTSLPLKSENYFLNKRGDAIRMRYRWPLKCIPTTYACGERFSVDHALSCFKGGFIHQRHVEIRDLFGQLPILRFFTTRRLNLPFFFSLVSNSMQLQMRKTRQDLTSVLMAFGNVDSEHFSMYGFSILSFLATETKSYLLPLMLTNVRRIGITHK